MKQLDTRLAALEKRTAPAGQVYVVWPGEEPPAKVGPRDAVVFVTFDGVQPDDEPTPQVFDLAG